VFSDGLIIADDTAAHILTDKETVDKASLKETSLYELALMCGIDDPGDYVKRFIDYEREVMR
ncbi:MAG: heme ABC transporter ATP-binding protein, partial [Lachnospiraceae bacterium]|nr:heme ABC transporter ATP-binding protein [Lachnospiraceae bacterium]